MEDYKRGSHTVPKSSCGGAENAAHGNGFCDAVVCLHLMATKSKTTARTRKTRAKIQRTVAKKAVSATTNGSQKRREVIVAAGGRQLNVLLKPASNRALIRLMKHYGLPAVQVVTQLLTDAAAQLRKPGKKFKSATVTSAAKSIRPRRSATGRVKQQPRATKGRAV